MRGVERGAGLIYAAKTASPLIIGLGEGENFLASDIPAVMGYTRNVLVLEDGDFARITPEGVTLTTLDGSPLQRDVFHVTWDVSTAQKGGFAHFMLKEIYDQPQAIRDTLRGRITETHQVTFPELKLPTSKLVHFNRIVIVACGTAYHAGLAGKNFYEHLLRRPVEVQVASEFRYNDPIVDAQTLAIIISQSGETADTLAALREAKIKGATTLAVVNVVGSVHRPRGRRGPLHLRRAGNLRRVHESLCHPAHRPVPARPVHRPGGEQAGAGRRRRLRRAASKTARTSLGDTGRHQRHSGRRQASTRGPLRSSSWAGATTTPSRRRVR